jgi:diacylglycerol kinase (ATP)
MKAVIVANPKAGGGRAFRDIRRHIEQWNDPDWDVDILTTKHPGHAGRLALNLLEAPPDLLAVCGGDGTVHEVASCLPAPPFPIAVLPAGTANVIARELKLPLNPVRALKIGLKRTVQRVDLGELGPQRRFVFVAGIGFDAYVAANVDASLKDRLGMCAYALAILRCLRTYTFSEFQVAVNERTFRATSCLVANAKSYGGGLLFCPRADMQDGLLDVLVLEGHSRMKLARFLFHAWMGHPERHAWIHRLQSRRVSITGSEDIMIQADGELAGTLPVDIRLLPSTFPLVVP